MSGIPGTGYDAKAAAEYREAREIPRAGLSAWRQAVADEAGLAPGMTVLDIGAGTGGFAAAFRDWFGVRVLAVEPAAAMRQLIPTGPSASAGGDPGDGEDAYADPGAGAEADTDLAAGAGIEALDGRAEALPVPDACADAAWLGSVMHHIDDLEAAAREVRRALRPGAPVLIRNTFPGRGERDLRVRFFPETAGSVSGYPTVEEVEAAFGTAGFRRVALRSLPQQSAPTLAAYADRLRRGSDTKLRALSDEAYERGLARLRAAAAADPAEQAVSWMDLLVLR